jgi:uronate dehydrogenase
MPSHEDNSYRMADHTAMRGLLTGAAGRIGAVLRDGLIGRYGLLRLCDVRGVGLPRPGEETVPADLTDPAAAGRVTAGIDAVIHLAATPHEDGWQRILPNNIVAVHRHATGTPQRPQSI